MFDNIFRGRGAYSVTGCSQQFAVWAELDCLQGRRVPRDDADVPRAHVDKLDLAGSTAGKGNHLVRQRAESHHIVCRLIHGDQIGRLLEAVQADAVLEDDGYPAPGQLHTPHRGERRYLYCDFAGLIVPDDGLLELEPRDTLP